jgi:plastocyanin
MSSPVLRSTALVIAILTSLGFALIISRYMTQPGPTPATEPKNVSIDNFSFSPQSLEIPAGTTVNWINHDDVPHTIKDTAQILKSGTLDTDDSYSFTFTKPGEYSYYCGVHPHMVGTIVVK